MQKLKLSRLDNVRKLLASEQVPQISADSPALSVFTDFRVKTPYTVAPDTSPADAERLMLEAHVKMKIVVDADNNLLGILGLKELDEERIITLVASGMSRDEITVADLMIPKDRLSAFSYKELASAKVRDVMEALKAEGLQHCLVVDDANQSICGLISASDIARKLHIPLSLHKAPSFAEIVGIVASTTGLHVDAA
jgi:CBS-domain-containing membrane protein